MPFPVAAVAGAVIGALKLGRKKKSGPPPPPPENDPFEGERGEGIFVPNETVTEEIPLAPGEIARFRNPGSISGPSVDIDIPGLPDSAFVFDDEGKPIARRVTRRRTLTERINITSEKYGLTQSELIEALDQGFGETFDLIDQADVRALQRFSEQAGSLRDAVSAEQNDLIDREESQLDTLTELSLMRQEMEASGFDGSITEFRRAANAATNAIEATGALQNGRSASLLRKSILGTLVGDDLAEFQETFGIDDPDQVIEDNPLFRLARRDASLLARTGGFAGTERQVTDRGELRAQVGNFLLKQLDTDISRGDVASRDIAKIRTQEGLDVGTALQGQGQGLSAIVGEQQELATNLGTSTNELLQGLSDRGIQGQILANQQLNEGLFSSESGRINLSNTQNLTRAGVAANTATTQLNLSLRGIEAQERSEQVRRGVAQQAADEANRRSDNFLDFLGNAIQQGVGLTLPGGGLTT